MRIQQILENTTAGPVASVAKPLMTQTRENTNVRGLKPVQQVMKGLKKQGPYANSISEGKVKQLAQDLKELTPHQFQDKYKQSKSEVRADMKNVNEDDLSEQDLIVIPGQGRLKRTGFVKHDLDQGEHEGETLKNSLHTIIRVATHLDKALSMSSEFPEWVSEKIGATKSMMVSVMDYLISSQEMQHDPDAMEGMAEDGPVDKYRDRIGTTGDIQRQNNRHQEYKDAEHQSSLSRISNRDRMDDASTQHEIEVLAHRLSRMQKDDDDWEHTFDMLRDRLNRYQSSTQRDVDPEQLAAISNIKYEPRKKTEEAAYAKTDDKLLAYYAQRKAEKEKQNQQQGAADGKIDFAKKLQKNVDKHNKAVVKTKKDIGSRVADIGPGGKEHNVKTDAAWDAAKKKVSEGAKVDRMVKHVTQSEKKLGNSKKEAENIAWATANRRGMLDNKNKKK